jgi:hypothetical protein
LTAFFFIPFAALLFQKIKLSKALLSLVSFSVVAGIFLARFIEIAPPLLGSVRGTGFGDEVIIPLLASIFLFAGCLGAGALLYCRFLRLVPMMPVGDELFLREFAGKSEHS